MTQYKIKYIKIYEWKCEHCGFPNMTDKKPGNKKACLNCKVINELVSPYKNNGRKISIDRGAIIKRYHAGWKAKDIAKHFEVGLSTVYSLVRKERNEKEKSGT